MSKLEFNGKDWVVLDTTEQDVINGEKANLEYPKIILADIRSKRNQLLAQCDWVMLPDAPITDEKKQEWVNYRQYLRDITESEDIFNIEFPTPPN